MQDNTTSFILCQEFQSLRNGFSWGFVGKNASLFLKKTSQNVHKAFFLSLGKFYSKYYLLLQKHFLEGKKRLSGLLNNLLKYGLYII